MRRFHAARGIVRPVAATTLRNGEGVSVKDALYVLGTLGFFWLMIGYVRRLERLGRRTAKEKEERTP